MRKLLRWPLWLLEAVPFFMVMGVFRLIGVDAASATGGFLARKLAPLAPAHRTARRNLTRAFPALSEAEIAATLKAMWDNLGRTFGEYAHFRAFAGFPNPRVTVEGLEIARAARAAGKGVIIISSHSANWEVMSMTVYLCGLDGVGIYRKANNPLVDAWILRQRRRYASPEMLPKTSVAGARVMLSTLKAGKTVGLLMDQKHREGVPIPFFGRDALTATGPALLALRTDAALLPVMMVRTKGAHFRMTFQTPLEITRTGDRDADMQAILVQVSQTLEAGIRAHPAQWLWAHDRWLERG